jgi:hypothetical protein
VPGILKVASTPLGGRDERRCSRGPRSGLSLRERERERERERIDMGNFPDYLSRPAIEALPNGRGIWERVDCW